MFAPQISLPFAFIYDPVNVTGNVSHMDRVESESGFLFSSFILFYFLFTSDKWDIYMRVLLSGESLCLPAMNIKIIHGFLKMALGMQDVEEKERICLMKSEIVERIFEWFKWEFKTNMGALKK